MIPTVALRLVNLDGSYGEPLPDWASITVGLEGGTRATLELSYRAVSADLAALNQGTELVVLLDGQEPPDGRFVLNAVSDDEVSRPGVITWKGNSELTRLADAMVYPQGWPTSVQPLGQAIDARTPGYALRVLLEKAQARGTLTGLTWTFTDNLDSDGTTWPNTITEFLDWGMSYLKVVERWAGRSEAVATMDGGELSLYAYTSYGTDRTATVDLKLDEDLTDGPTMLDTEDLGTVILAITDTSDGIGLGVERQSNPGVTTWGRRERPLSQAGVPDQSTLEGIADGALSLYARQREEFTYGLTQSTSPRPWLDYDRGDTLRVRTLRGIRVKKLRAMTLTWGSDGARSGSLSFGDRFRAADEQAVDRTEQLTGGSVDDGLYNSPLLPGPVGESVGGGGGDVERDTVPPNPPTDLAATSVTVFNLGYLSATATLTWDAPTTNVDATPLTDLSQFEVQYRHVGYPLWEPGGYYVYDTPQAVVTGLTAGEDYEWRVRALDFWGNASAWATDTFTADQDTDNPTEQPSTPVVTAFLYDALLITWDGLAQGGTAVDNDTRHVEVHVSTSTGFTPGPGTWRATIEIPGGQTVVAGLTPGTTYYVRLVLVDWAGNVGLVSNQATGVPAAVDAGDLADGAVTTSKLANLAVTAAKIDNLAVTNAKIADLSATKITAGTLSAVVTLTGSITTRPGGTGAGATTDSTGFRLYNAANNITVNLNAATGDATFTGTISAAEVTGYIRAISGLQQIVLWPSGLFPGTTGLRPSIAISTGVGIEEYAGGMFAEADSFLRLLRSVVISPATLFRDNPNTPPVPADYVATKLAVQTEPVDGNFDGSLLPTLVTGKVRVDFPQPALSGAGSGPRAVLWSNFYGNDPQVENGSRPALELVPTVGGQRSIGLRGDPDGAIGMFVVCTTGGTAFARILASAFTVSSDSRLKVDVGDPDWNPLEVVRRNKARRWRRRHNVTQPDGTIREELADPEFGIMADDLPDDIRHVDTEGNTGYDLHGLIGVHHAVLHQVLDRLDQLERTTP